MLVLRVRWPSIFQEIPGDDQRTSNEDFRDGVNGGTYVEEEDDFLDDEKFSHGPGRGHPGRYAQPHAQD